MSAAELFVYGTLLRGSANPHARLLSQNAEFRGAARVRARLFLVADYPGAAASDLEGEWVFGELWTLREPEAALAALDAYEGSEFTRARVSVIAESGAASTAWIYWYNRPTGGLVPILSGRFAG